MRAEIQNVVEAENECKDFIASKSVISVVMTCVDLSSWHNDINRDQNVIRYILTNKRFSYVLELLGW